MSLRAAAWVVALILAGCASAGPSVSSRSGRLLARADEQLAAGQYRAAATLYDEFLKNYPNDSDIERVRATRRALTEIERLKLEVDRLRADLERLRSIDLQRQPQPR